MSPFPKQIENVLRFLNSCDSQFTRSLFLEDLFGRANQRKCIFAKLELESEKLIILNKMRRQ